MYRALFALHLLAAMLWAGGALLLAALLLPAVLRGRAAPHRQTLECGFERLEMPALALQVATGLWMALHLVPDWTHWLTLHGALARAIGLKAVLLVAALGLTLRSRRQTGRPGVAGAPALAAWPLALRALLALGLVLTGVSFRYGGLGH